MAKLNVYRCMLGGRAEVMVAAGSRKAAAELMGLSAYELATYGDEAIGEDAEIALAAPGVVFRKADGLALTGEWDRICLASC